MSFGMEEPTDINLRMWYRIYPYDGSVTPSVASGSIKNGGSVTFTTPQCKWPTYYVSSYTNGQMVTGQMWPDVLVTSSTTGWPADPTYANAARTAYNSSTQNTSATFNLTANKTNFVKVRLASDNDTQNGSGRDVEYADKINTYIFYPQNAPTATPAGGTYTTPQSVTLSGAKSGQIIRYTTDGNDPTASSSAYDAPILGKNTTIKAQIYEGDVPMSPVGTYGYTLNIPAVTASPTAGSTVMRGSEVLLTTTHSEQTDILYTTNPTQPREAWTVYQSPISISKDLTLYVVTRDKASGWYGEVREFAYAVTDLGYTLNDLSFWRGSAKVTLPDITALAGKTVTAKANITKIIPSIQGWLVTALYDPSGRAQAIKLDKLDQISGVASGDAVGKSITLPADTTNCVLKTFIVHDFAQLRPVSAVVQIGEKAE